MLREGKPGIASLRQRPVPSLDRTLEAMRMIRSRGPALSNPLEREAKLTASAGPGKR
jgi:hypothetical protein